MSKYLNLIAMAVILPLLLVSCGNDDTMSPTSNNAPFTFIKDYTQWVYNKWVYGVYDGTNNELLGIYSWAIYPTVPVPNYVVALSTNELGYDNAIGFKVDNKELWVIGGYVPDNCSIFLHKDCYIGKEWKLDCCEGTAKIISLSERVTVPAGTFKNCIKIEVQYSDERKNYYWVNKNSGNIMAEENNKIYKLHSKNFK